MFFSKSKIRTCVSYVFYKCNCRCIYTFSIFYYIYIRVSISDIMKQVKITIIRKAEYRDLMERYENPIEHACDMQLGAEFISQDAMRPDGMCESAWMSLQPFVFALASGASNLYDGWMRNPHTAMVSCNDGFRPVSFLLEAIE